LLGKDKFNYFIKLVQLKKHFHRFPCLWFVSGATKKANGPVSRPLLPIVDASAAEDSNAATTNAPCSVISYRMLQMRSW